MDTEQQARVDQLSADMAAAYGLTLEEATARIGSLFADAERQVVEMRDVHLPAMIALLPPCRD